MSTTINTKHAPSAENSISSACSAVSALIVVLLLATPVCAQGVGFQGGVALDPSQVYVGTHYETAPIGDRIHFRPSIDGGFGSGIELALVDITFEYKVPLSTLSPWSIYQGTGPAITIQRANDEVHAHGGLGAVFGFEHKNGFFVEFKVTGYAGPSLRLGIGYAVRRPRQ